jgi:hypothetical protein
LRLPWRAPVGSSNSTPTFQLPAFFTGRAENEPTFPGKLAPAAAISPGQYFIPTVVQADDRRAIAFVEMALDGIARMFAQFLVAVGAWISSSFR